MILRQGRTSLLTSMQIAPSEKLEWHPCLGRFKCARLTVPMDYHRPLNASKDNPKVHIALLMVPGTHNGPRKFSTSPLLLNPGGPGGSGVLMALGFGERIHKIVGADQDVIGFDPRGVGSTTPRADCFSYPPSASDAGSAPDSAKEDYARGDFHRFLWLVSGKDVGTVNSSSDSLLKLDVRARTKAKLCEEKNSFNGRDSIMRHVHTPSVARDMLSIVDAWDEWTGTLESESVNSPENEIDNERPKTEESSSLDTKGKLFYWGFSYGVCPPYPDISALVSNYSVIFRPCSAPPSHPCSQTELVV